MRPHQDRRRSARSGTSAATPAAAGMTARNCASKRMPHVAAMGSTSCGRQGQRGDHLVQERPGDGTQQASHQAANGPDAAAESDPEGQSADGADGRPGEAVHQQGRGHLDGQAPGVPIAEAGTRAGTAARADPAPAAAPSTRPRSAATAPARADRRQPPGQAQRKPHGGARQPQGQGRVPGPGVGPLLPVRRTGRSSPRTPAPCPSAGRSRAWPRPAARTPGPPRRRPPSPRRGPLRDRTPPGAGSRRGRAARTRLGAGEEGGGVGVVGFHRISSLGFTGSVGGDRGHEEAGRGPGRSGSRRTGMSRRSTSALI